MPYSILVESDRKEQSVGLIITSLMFSQHWEHHLVGRVVGSGGGSLFKFLYIITGNKFRVKILFRRHQARESEPKDYNISTDPVRNLKRATYDRLASITDGVRMVDK